MFKDVKVLYYLFIILENVLDLKVFFNVVDKLLYCKVERCYLIVFLMIEFMNNFVDFFDKKIVIIRIELFNEVIFNI